MVHRAPNTLTQRDKKLHGKKRRVISQGFSDNALRAFEGPITAQIQKFSGLLGGNKNDYSTEDDLFTEQSSENWSPVRDMARWCEFSLSIPFYLFLIFNHKPGDYLAFDIMAAVTFSASYDTLGSIENRPVIKAIETSNVRMSVLLQAPGLPKFHQKLFPDAIAARNVFIKFVNRMLKERYARIEKNNKDIFSFLAEAKDPETGKGFDDNELGAESTTLVVAGMVSHLSLCTIPGNNICVLQGPILPQQPWQLPSSTCPTTPPATIPSQRKSAPPFLRQRRSASVLT